MSADVLNALQGVRFIAQQIKKTDAEIEVNTFILALNFPLR